MDLKKLVLQWNNTWRYDYWWRKKHNVSFNSKEHREVDQFTIAFEYFENRLAEKALEELTLEEEKKKFRDKRIVMMPKKIDEKRQQEILDKVDLSSFN